MFGWLKKKVDAASSKAMNTDIDRYLAGLRGANAEQLGMIVAVATHWRHSLVRSGIDVMNPEDAAAANPMAAFRIGQLIKEAQAKDGAHATALMVWLHTMRAGAYPELRYKGQEMWRELAQGFPHVWEAAESLQLLTGNSFYIEGYDQIPEGMVNNRRSSSA